MMAKSVKKTDAGKAEYLFKEISRWENLKIITKVQSQKIRSLYSKDADTAEQHLTLANYIAIFGTIMIGVGVILFFALNWATIPKTVKVFSIIAALVASQHIGFVMRYQKHTLPKVGATLIFLGCIFFGSGIFLIAQIYNINAHWPNGFLFWTLGIIAIAYLSMLVPIVFLMIVTATAYIISESMYWFGLVDRYSYVPYAFFLVLLAMGILYYMLGLIHERKVLLKKISYPFHLVGAFFILASMYLFSFKDFARPDALVERIQRASVLFQSRFWLIFLLLAGTAILSWVYVFMQRDRKNVMEFYELFIPVSLLVFTPVVALFARYNFWLMPVIFNIILFILIIGVMYLGIAKKDKTLVNMSLFAFGVAVFSRYVEYLWNVINGYLFFLIAGLLLIGLAILLEKNRRKLFLRLEE